MLPYELTEGKLIIHILHIYYNTHSGGVSLQQTKEKIKYDDRMQLFFLK